MAKVTPIASVRTILDAANPAAASAGVLALLEDEDLEVASIGLTDGTGTALAAGRLSLNAASQVVIHDNESNTEDLPHLVNSLESINFATRVLAATMSNASYTKKLTDIPLPASALTNGKQLHLIGRTFALWLAGNQPDGGAFLVLCKEGQDPTSVGVYSNFAEGITSEDREFHIPLAISVASTTWTLSRQGGSLPAALIRKNNAGTITHSAGWAIGTDYGPETIAGPTGEPVKLELHILTFDTSDTVTATLFASGQISIIHE